MFDSGDDTSSDLITRNLPCIACGYNLRGLREDGTCPECGALVSRSVEAYQRLLANPYWLWRLRLGLLLVVWCPGVFIAGGFVITPLIVAYVIHPYFPDSDGELIAVALLYDWLFIAWAIGAYVYTVAEPGVVEEPGRHERLIARGLVQAWLLVTVFANVVIVGFRLPGGWVAIVISALVFFAASIALGLYARRVAWRLRQPALAEQCFLSPIVLSVVAALCVVLIVVLRLDSAMCVSVLVGGSCLMWCWLVVVWQHGVLSVMLRGMPRWMTSKSNSDGGEA